MKRLLCSLTVAALAVVLQLKPRYLAVLALIFGLVGRADAQTYTVTDLGLLPGYPSAQGRAVNGSGQVAGFSCQRPDGFGLIGHAFRWTNGVMQDLGTLGGSQSWALGINDAGQVCGVAQGGKFLRDRAFLYSGGTMLDITRQDYSHALAIGNTGQIVGEIQGGTVAAFSWANGTTLLPGLTKKGGSSATAVNDSGLIAGSATDAAGVGRAVIWTAGKISALPSLVAGGSASASGINNQGDVVGNSNDHPVLWRRGAVIDLAPSGFVAPARDINNLGQVLGDFHVWQDLNGNGLADPGEAHDLRTRLDPVSGAGWTLVAAFALNDSGQISALAQIGGVGHAVLLTPQ